MPSLNTLLEVLGSVTSVTGKKLLSSKRASAACFGCSNEMHHKRHTESEHCEKSTGYWHLSLSNANLSPVSHVGTWHVTFSCSGP